MPVSSQNIWGSASMEFVGVFTNMSLKLCSDSKKGSLNYSGVFSNVIKLSRWCALTATSWQAYLCMWLFPTRSCTHLDHMSWSVQWRPTHWLWLGSLFLCLHEPDGTSFLLTQHPWCGTPHIVPHEETQWPKWVSINDSISHCGVVLPHHLKRSKFIIFYKGLFFQQNRPASHSNTLASAQWFSYPRHL